MNERNLQKTEKVLVSVQRFYESKLRDWAFDCQQNQSPQFYGGCTEIHSPALRPHDTESAPMRVGSNNGLTSAPR
jgi:hypothetical protein